MIKNNFVKKINKIDCDIVNLHWVGNNLLSIYDIKKINKPIVWTMHDMWPYTGSEHYTFSKRFIDGYTKKNKPETIRGFDIEKFCWEQKMKYYPKNIVVIPTSSWQLDNVKKSKIFKDNLIEKILYPIDFKEWKQYNKQNSRESLNLPLDKKIILCGAVDVDAPRKGFNKFIKTIKNTKFDKNTMLLFFGNKKIINLENIECRYLGKINNESLDMKFIYSASDLMVAPSVQESFGQTALEAASCGLPSVCFEGTGFCDVIDHKVNGYLVKREDEKGLIDGINWCLKNWSNNLAKENIANLLKKFSYDIIGEKYLKLYKEILKY